MTGRFPIEEVRARFPGLLRSVGGVPAAFLDGAAGSQVPQSVADAVAHSLLHQNANRGGAFETSREVGDAVDAARAAVADFVGGAADEIVFGPSMTALCFLLSRSLSQAWHSGDEVLVTRLDHDANVTPWVVAAEAKGATVRHVELRQQDGTLDLNDLDEKLRRGPRVLAVTAASNLLGSMPDLALICERAHAHGTTVVVDAVHYAPHGAIDVAAWSCDFLLCSAYKFFGPHVGVLWGRRELLRELPPWRVRPAPQESPESWELGTSNHEGLAGTRAAIDYLVEVGRLADAASTTRRASLERAMAAITDYERGMQTAFLEGAAAIPGLRVHGITDVARGDERTPTFALTHDRHSPARLAHELAERGIFGWHGNNYALEPSRALGLEPHGVLRVGFLHYNTMAEVERLLEELRSIARLPSSEV